MKNETTYFTSPRTGTVYTVVAFPQSRAAWDENGVKYDRQYTEYRIFHGGTKVQFAFDVDGVERAVAHYEGYHDGVTSSPRD